MTGEPESLETIEPLAARRARHDFDRLIMLSDGVFAIAIGISSSGSPASPWAKRRLHTTIGMPKACARFAISRPMLP